MAFYDVASTIHQSLADGPVLTRESFNSGGDGPAMFNRETFSSGDHQVSRFNAGDRLLFNAGRGVNENKQLRSSAHRLPCIESRLPCI